MKNIISNTEVKNEASASSTPMTKTLQRRKAAVYLRYSVTPNDPQYPVATKEQADAIHEYAEKHQLEIIKTYVDEKGRERDGRERMIKDVQSGTAEYKVILIQDGSRLTRDTRDYGGYKCICRQAGINLICTGYKTQAEDDVPSEQFVENIMVALSNMERDNDMKYLQSRRSTYDYAMQHVDDEPAREFVEGLMVAYGRLEGQIKVKSAGKNMGAYLAQHVSNTPVKWLIESIWLAVENLGSAVRSEIAKNSSVYKK